MLFQIWWRTIGGGGQEALKSHAGVGARACTEWGRVPTHMKWGRAKGARPGGFGGTGNLERILREFGHSGSIGLGRGYIGEGKIRTLASFGQ